MASLKKNLLTYKDEAKEKFKWWTTYARKKFDSKLRVRNTNMKLQNVKSDSIDLEIKCGSPYLDLLSGRAPT